MSNINDFIIKNGMITKYNGKDRDVVIPDDALALEDEAEDLLDLISEMGGTNQSSWVMDCYFVSYTDGEMSFKVGDVINDGYLVTEEYVTLYIDGNGNGKLIMEGSDSIEFYYDVEAFELYEVANVKFYDEKYMELIATIENTYEGNVIFEVATYVNGTYWGTQVYTFTSYYGK